MKKKKTTKNYAQQMLVANIVLDPPRKLKSQCVPEDGSISRTEGVGGISLPRDPQSLETFQ